MMSRHMHNLSQPLKMSTQPCKSIEMTHLAVFKIEIISSSSLSYSFKQQRTCWMELQHSPICLGQAHEVWSGSRRFSLFDSPSLTSWRAPNATAIISSETKLNTSRAMRHLFCTSRTFQMNPMLHCFLKRYFDLPVSTILLETFCDLTLLMLLYFTYLVTLRELVFLLQYAERPFGKPVITKLINLAFGLPDRTTRSSFVHFRWILNALLELIRLNSRLQSVIA